MFNIMTKITPKAPKNLMGPFNVFNLGTPKKVNTIKAKKN